jgi:hypothetical protein
MVIKIEGQKTNLNQYKNKNKSYLFQFDRYKSKTIRSNNMYYLFCLKQMPTYMRGLFMTFLHIPTSMHYTFWKELQMLMTDN